MKSLTKILSAGLVVTSMYLPSTAKAEEKSAASIVAYGFPHFPEPEDKPWNSIAKANFGGGVTFDGHGLFDVHFDALDVDLKRPSLLGLKDLHDKRMLHAEMSADFSSRNLESSFRAEASYLTELWLASGFHESSRKFARVSLDGGLVVGTNGKLGRDDYLTFYAGVRHGIGGLKENGRDDFLGRSRNGHAYLDFPVVGIMMEEDKRAALGGRLVTRFEHLFPGSKNWGQGITFDFGLLYSGRKTLLEQDASYYIKHVFTKKRALLDKIHFGLRSHAFEDKGLNFGLVTFVGLEG